MARLTIATLLIIQATPLVASAQTTKVEVVIENVAVERREVTVSYAAGTERKTIILDVSRKAEISLNGKVATIESLGAGLKASIAYDKSLEVVTSIAATGDLSGPPQVVQISELKGTSPWLTADGLTVYWELPEVKIATARRDRPDAYFTEIKELFPGRHPTVSVDELEIVLLVRGSSGETLHSARRAGKDQSFSRAEEIRELALQPSPKNPCLLPDGLTMLFNRASGKRSEIVVTTRSSRTTPWAQPQPLPIQNVPADGSLTWPHMSADGLRLFCSHEGGNDNSSDRRGKLVVFGRKNHDEPFGSPKYINLKAFPSLVGRSPRYVESTHELFFVSLTNPPGSIAVIKNFDPATAIATPELSPLSSKADLLVGTFQVTWTESDTGKSGTFNYTFQGDGVVLRNGQITGTWQTTQDGALLKFSDPQRGQVTIKFSGPDAFAGTHARPDGKTAKWQGKRGN